MRPARSEAELLADYRAGDTGAATELLTRIAPVIDAAVRNFCRRWARWYPEVDDLMQEGRIIFLRALDYHKEEGGDLARYVRHLVETNLMEKLGAHSTLRRRRGLLRRHAAMERAGGEVPGWALPMPSLDEEDEGGHARVDDVTGTDPGPEEAFATREVTALALQYVKELDPVRADVLRRRYLAVETQKQGEIGAALGVSRSYAGTLEQEALRRVRKRLLKQVG